MRTVMICGHTLPAKALVNVSNLAGPAAAYAERVSWLAIRPWTGSYEMSAIWEEILPHPLGQEVGEVGVEFPYLIIRKSKGEIRVRYLV